ncbi:MAG TPA: guanylate kinase [Chitinivibrionales bacterium]|nr:guanylate kinase [Chitinivibrionales bacterium]
MSKTSEDVPCFRCVCNRMTTLEEPSDRSKHGKIFVFSAASGAGKTTLLEHLRNTVPGLVYSISATTRLPRTGEKDGVHYFFLSEKEFKKKMEAGEFAEWAVVHGHFYGTPRCFIDDTVVSGKHIIMDIDVIGKKKFDTVYPQAVGILILPPSIEILRQRLEKRGTDSREAIDLRITNAVREMDFARNNGKYQYTVVNDELARAKSDVVNIVRNEIAAR